MAHPVHLTILGDRLAPWLLATTLLCWSFLASAASPELVTLQLKWQHQFQFAGYYAAQEKGYYRDNGLDVRFVEAGPETNVIEEVTSGRAQFGVGNSALLLARQRGEPVVALAVIFQHSPLVIIGNIYAGVASVQDLKGKRVMLEKHSEELLAYLRQENVAESSIEIVPHSLGTEELILGQVDAISGYSSSEPYYIDKAFIPQLTLSPRSAGIDFYGDNLFTSETEVKQRPERVKAFREASLKGWAYAMENPEEIISLILEKYSTKHSREFLQFEAGKLRPLIGNDLVAIGYMHAERWQHIINTYAKLDLLARDFPLKGFLYTSNPDEIIERERQRWLAGLAIILLVSVAAVVIASLLLRLNRRMKQEMAARELAVAELSKSEQRFRFMAENTGDVIWIMDIASGRFSYVSPAVYELRGFTPEEVLKQPVAAALTPESAERAHNTLSESIARWQSGDRTNTQRVTEIDQPHKDGRLIHTEVVTTLHADAEGRLTSVIGVTRNITERKRAEEAIRQLAFYDPLTQLPNRRLLQDRIPQLLARARREKSRLALLFIDLDKFKPVNDDYGHDIGDELLKLVAQRLRDGLRESDTVARIGGDEFVALLPDIQQIESAVATARKLCDELQKPYRTAADIELNISSSIGIAIYPDNGSNDQDLLRLADEAMYRAKKQGRNRVELLTPGRPSDMDDRFSRRHALVRLYWKNGFNSGHPLIDQQHHELFDLANDLLDTSIDLSTQPEPFDRAFNAVFEHTRQHFADEERILETYAYPELEEHAREHRKLLQHSLELRQRLDKSANVLGELIDFLLSEVIAGHFLREDRKFFALFAKAAEPTSLSEDQ